VKVPVLFPFRFQIAKAIVLLFSSACDRCSRGAVDYGIVNGIGDVVDILRGDSANVHAATRHHVDVVFGLQVLDLVRREAGVAEHADLGHQVRPGAGRAKRTQTVVKQFAHLLDACTSNKCIDSDSV